MKRPTRWPPSDALMEDWHELYPFGFHEIFVEGMRYHYLDEGTGPVLLLVHGNPTWSFYWRDLVKELRKSYRVIVPDHVGCGLSARPTRREYPFTLQRRMDDLNALVERLELRDITLIAHDWGGPIGLGAAIDNPDRFSRFILCNTAAFRSDRCPWIVRACRIPIFGDVMVKGFNAFVHAANRTTVTRPLSKQVRAGYLAPYDSWRNRIATLEFVRDLAFSPKDRSYATFRKLEDGLALFRDRPVCLIWGLRDWCFPPAFMERFQEIYPQAEIYPFQDAGHYVVEDAHDRMAPIIEEFLRNAAY